MFTGIIGLVISFFSFIYFTVKAFSKKSTSFMKREMETYYIGTNK